MAKLVKDFNEVDLNKIQNATNLIKSMESQIPEWSDPAKFPKLYKELQENIKTINENLKWNKEATNLEKVLILEQVNRLTDVMDKSTKALERSTQYLDSMKDAKGNDLQTARFKDMITEFYGVMETWVNNVPSITIFAQVMIQRIKDDLNSEANTKLSKKEFDLSSDFAVSRAVINFLGMERCTPKTLEDIFTLIHQNTIIAINSLDPTINSKLNKQYPNLVNSLDQAFSNKIQGEQNKKITLISTHNDINYPILKITKNIPLRGHANVAEIKHNIKDRTTTVNFSLLGENQVERNRLEYIALNNCLELKLADFSLINPPYLDKEKGIVNFEVKIENEQQIDKLIDIVNKSTQISYDFAAGNTYIDSYVTEWLKNQVGILNELAKKTPKLQTEFENFKLLPNIDFTYKQFQQLDSKSKDFFIKDAYSMQKFLQQGSTPTQIMDSYDKNYTKAKELFQDDSGFSKIVKLAERSVTDLKYLIDNKSNIKNLIKIQGFNLDGIDKLLEGKFENFKFLIEKAFRIKALTEIKSFNLDIIDKLSEGKFENFKFLVNKTNNLKTLIKIKGVDANTINELSEGKFENLKYLINNANNFKSLVEEGFIFDEVIKCKGQDLNQLREQIEDVSKKNNINYLRILVNNDVNKLIDLLSDSSVTNNLYSQKIDLDQISQLSNQDLEKAKFLLSNYDVIKENFLNKDSKLTPEDLKKCNLADIQNLAKGTITAEQLKTSLTEKAPVGKWVAKVQEGRQTIAKETKGSQR